MDHPQTSCPQLALTSQGVFESGMGVSRDKPKGIQCMPSGFTPVVIDLRPSMKVTIPWDKPRGIQCMPSGFMPVVIDLRPRVKVMIPWDKPKGLNQFIKLLDQACKPT
jgi:hypothetical protein